MKENSFEKPTKLYEIPEGLADPDDPIDKLIVDFSQYLADNETGLEYAKFTEETFTKYVQEKLANTPDKEKEELKQNLDKVRQELLK